MALVLILAFLWLPCAAASVSGKETMYVGGTIAGLSEGTIGSLDSTSEKALKFNSPKGNFEIPYENITSLEYGQKAGRRLAVTILTGSWVYLLSKKRKHFLTIGFTDANEKPQGVVLEIPKGTAKSFITILEVRSGKKVEYESEEAKKHVHG
ncbi:MAG: hypothetical protein HY234_09855 [Acidobacteria bacterium]|nr:hypothetical protein [Acidobacteriota bacterium]MBI3663340.1 hypothetical protein [Acidobacteriota bacterium]